MPCDSPADGPLHKMAARDSVISLFRHPRRDLLQGMVYLFPNKGWPRAE
jgi:hypothetical protein